MTWTLNATGHAANEDDERGLVAELSRVLSNHKAGTASSGFVGQYHNGPAHGLPKEPSARQRASKGAEE
jgi:hypothetical protein